jgi:hypothetical protein
MNWKSVGNLVVEHAPLVGGILLGPAGGLAGTILSSVYGTKNEPDEVLKAIQADPEAAVTLMKIQSDNAVELKRVYLAAETRRIEEETKQQAETNKTIRDEAKSDNWWTSGWRPYWGFISGTAFFVVVCAICYFVILAIKTKDASLLLVLPQVVMAIAALFSIPGAILGVSAWHRGKLQRIKAGELPVQGAISSLLGRLKRK